MFPSLQFAKCQNTSQNTFIHCLVTIFYPPHLLFGYCLNPHSPLTLVWLLILILGVEAETQA